MLPSLPDTRDGDYTHDKDRNYNLSLISIILKIITITIMVVTRLTMSTPMWFSVGAAVTAITREAKIEMVIFFCFFSAHPFWTY